MDDRDNHNPGFKFNEWEIKGTPVRIELGKKDMEKEEARVCIRFNGKKYQEAWAGLDDKMAELMEQIHNDMYKKAESARQEHLREVTNWNEFMDALNKKDICLAPWCEDEECEDKIKEVSKEESLKAMEECNEDEVVLTGSAKTLCIPHKLGK